MPEENLIHFYIDQWNHHDRWQNRWTHWSRSLEKLRSPDAGHEVIYEANARDHRRYVTCAVTWVGMR